MLALMLTAIPALSASPFQSSETLPTGTNSSFQREQELDGYRVKAGLLRSFLKYSKFPSRTFANERSPIVVLVVGADPFGPLLKKAFAKTKFDGRSILIRRLRHVPNHVCAHLVFAHGLSETEQTELITKVRDQPSLLVSDTPGFAEHGGFLNIYEDEGKVRFEINAGCLKGSDVQLKADLLKLARIVEER